MFVFISISISSFVLLGVCKIINVYRNFSNEKYILSVITVENLFFERKKTVELIAKLALSLRLHELCSN